VNARRGSAAFANDWQWLIGFPVLAALLWFFRAYLNEDAEQLLSGATAFSVFLAALIAFFITMLACFLVRLLVEASKLFYREKDRADHAEGELQLRLTPRITAFLDTDCEGIRIVGTRETQQRALAGATGAIVLPPVLGRREPEQKKWVQIMVSSTTDAPLVDCEIRLMRVEPIDNDRTARAAILTESVFCKSSHAGA
jgi:hypothetical protein